MVVLNSARKTWPVVHHPGSLMPSSQAASLMSTFFALYLQSCVCMIVRTEIRLTLMLKCWLSEGNTVSGLKMAEK